MTDAIDFTGELTGVFTSYAVNDKDYPHIQFLDPDVRPYSKVQCLRIGGHEFPLPSKGSNEAAGFDLRTIGPLHIYPDQQVMVPTGWAFSIPRGYMGLIRDRSGMAVGRITTRAGVIDSDYRGEVKVLLVNEGDSMVSLEAGTRIAQMIIIPITDIVMEEIEELVAMTARGGNGFGSTGVK